MSSCYPAIDLRDGNVRAPATRATSTPRPSTTTIRCAVAREFEAAGRAVDPRGRPRRRAHRRAARNLDADRRDRARRRLPGAGRAAACGRSTRRGELLDAGVERVVVGTAAVERPELVDELCRESSRARRGRPRRPRQRGRGPRLGRRERAPTWSSSPSRFDGIGRRRARSSPRSVATARSRAPTFGQLGAVLGGQSDPADRERRGGHARRPARARPARAPATAALAGVIVGRAIYEGRFNVAEALASLRRGRGRLTPSAIRSGDTQHHRSTSLRHEEECAHGERERRDRRRILPAVPRVARRRGRGVRRARARLRRRRPCPLGRRPRRVAQDRREALRVPRARGL